MADPVKILDQYRRLYNQAFNYFNDCKEIEVIAIRGKYLSDLLNDQIPQIMV